MKILVALLIFSLIIVIHELGHFLLAKKNGIGVTEFSIGMGPRILSFKGKETRYSIKILPFGGSCMMLGEDELVEDDHAFNKKGVWARISVIAAGPIFNFILAFVLAMIVIGVVGYDPAQIVRVQENMPAAEAGLQVGDLITEVGGTNIVLGRDYDAYTMFHPFNGEPISISYERDGVKNEVEVQPIKISNYMMGFGYSASETEMKITSITPGGALAKAGVEAGDVITSINGVSVASGSEFAQYIKENPLSDQAIDLMLKRDSKEFSVSITPILSESYTIGLDCNLGRVKTSPLGAIRYSAAEVRFWVKTTVQSLGQLVRGKVDKDEIAGPVGIVDMIGSNYEASKESGALMVVLTMLNISIMLSANLGVMNLLPIPALDGGRLVFLIIEAVRGKPIDREKEGMVHMIGLIALMILMVLIVFNDVSKLF